MSTPKRITQIFALTHNYYKEIGEVTSKHKDDNRKRFETYAWSMDVNDDDKDINTAQGYTLSQLLEALNKKLKKKPTATHFIEAYVANNKSVLQAILKVYGVKKADFKKAYREAIVKLYKPITERHESLLAGIKDKTFPDRLHNLKFETHGALKAGIKQLSFACLPGVVIPGNQESKYCVLFVKDKDTIKNVSDFSFSFSKEDGCNCRYGSFIKERTGNFFYREIYVADEETEGTSSYNAYILYAPQTPALTVEDKQLKVVFGKPSQAAQDGCIDSYKMQIKRDGNVIKEVKVPIKDAVDGWSTPLSSINAKEGDKLDITVQECIEASGDKPECLGPVSGSSQVEAQKSNGPLKSGILFKADHIFFQSKTPGKAKLSTDGKKITIAVPALQNGEKRSSAFTLTGTITNVSDQLYGDQTVYAYEGTLDSVSNVSYSETEVHTSRYMGRLTESTTINYTLEEPGTFKMYYDPTGHAFAGSSEGWSFNAQCKLHRTKVESRKSSSGKVNETKTTDDGVGNMNFQLSDGGN